MALSKDQIAKYNADAKERGSKEREAGVPREDNPYRYDNGAGEWLAWNEGWDDGRPVRQFVVFTFESHEACGGWSDFSQDFDHLAEATQFGYSVVEARPAICFQVVDLQTGKIVAQG